jgi:DNA adenine methylase
MYAYEMTDEDHEVLARVLHQAQAMVIISGYECDLYRDLFGRWTQFQKDHVIDGGKKRYESIWLNPAAAANMPAPALLNLLPNEPSCCYS